MVGITNHTSQAAPNRKRPKRMPWVIPVNCEGCGDCTHRCPRHGLVMIETNVQGVYVPWLLDPDQCIGCAKCAEGCVMGGIVMTEYVDMAYQRFLNERPRIGN